MALSQMIKGGIKGGAALFLALNIYDYSTSSTRSSIERTSFLANRITRHLDAEFSHKIGVFVTSLPRYVRIALGLVDTTTDAPVLATSVWNRKFNNPVGIAAGFDKDAESMQGLLDLGFGFVEIGSVTPQPQPGNPQPRVFRLPQDNAVINRYGFNSQGHDSVATRLDEWSKTKTGVLGVNLGKNKTTVDAAVDYVAGVKSIGKYADYLIVNVSSPNTPGLRALQSRESLSDLLTQVKAARDKLTMASVVDNSNGSTSSYTLPLPPLLLKIAPDLTDQDKKDIAQVAMNVGIDGLIVSNTTIERPQYLQNDEKVQTGGLSGAPVRDRSTALVGEMYKLTKGQVPIIGVGGIATGKDAYDKIRAGASLVQLYSSFALEGPIVVSRVKDGLAYELQKDGFKSVQEAVGADHRKK